jgi:putative SOS response-associated peptidase YedK
MCSNIAGLNKQQIKRLKRMYGEDVKFDLELARHGYYKVSGFSHPLLPVLSSENPKEFQFMLWSLLPFWCIDEEKAQELSNMSLYSKAETIFEKPMFRKSILTKHCILPVEGFYEWREIAKIKYPYYIYPKYEGLFSLGCIYDTWTNKETGEIINSLSIVTIEANNVMAMIHNIKKRMPLILDGNNWMKWIDLETQEEELVALMKPAPGGILNYHTISKDISNRRIENNYSEIKNKVIYSELHVL